MLLQPVTVLSLLFFAESCDYKADVVLMFDESFSMKLDRSQMPHKPVNYGFLWSAVRKWSTQWLQKPGARETRFAVVGCHATQIFEEVTPYLYLDGTDDKNYSEPVDLKTKVVTAQEYVPYVVKHFLFDRNVRGCMHSVMKFVFKANKGARAGVKKVVFWISDCWFLASDQERDELKKLLDLPAAFLAVCGQWQSNKTTDTVTWGKLKEWVWNDETRLYEYMDPVETSNRMSKVICDAESPTTPETSTSTSPTSEASSQKESSTSETSSTPTTSTSSKDQSVGTTPFVPSTKARYTGQTTEGSEAPVEYIVLGVSLLVVLLLIVLCIAITLCIAARRRKAKKKMDKKHGPSLRHHRSDEKRRKSDHTYEKLRGRPDDSKKAHRQVLDRKAQEKDQHVQAKIPWPTYDYTKRKTATKSHREPQSRASIKSAPSRSVRRRSPSSKPAKETVHRTARSKDAPRKLGHGKK